MRHYKLKKNGKEVEYPSVTSLTEQLSKPALYYFFGKHGIQKAKEISKEATDIGDAVHSYIKKYFEYTQEGLIHNRSHRRPIDNFHKFLKQYKPQPVLLEHTVYSHKKRFAGTFDGLFNIDNKLILLDWKTSSNIYPEYELQLVAYDMALTEMVQEGIITIEGIKVDDRWVVRLDKESPINFKTDVKSFKKTKKAVKAIDGLIQIYNWRKKNG